MIGERVHCVVPGCPHWRHQQAGDWMGMEWICRWHWRSLPKRPRLIHSRLKRQLKKLLLRHHGLITIEEAVLIGREKRVWAIIKRKAIERAMGIA